MSPTTKAWSLIVVLAAAAVAPRGAFAQTSNVTCLSSFDWMNNSRSQNPCLVAAYIQGVCNSGQFEVDALPVNLHYIGPTLDEVNACQCSTVTYSLISACGDCQNRTYINWSSWSYNCSTIYNSSFAYDIPSGTAVPDWAYLNVVTSDLFSPTAAQLVLASPESTATKVQSTGSVIASTSFPASVTPSPTAGSTATASPTSTSSNVGAIAGGVIGGIVAVAAIAGVAAWFYAKRRRSSKAKSTFSDIGGGPGYTNSVYSANPVPFTMQPQMAQQQRLYDPSDPSTFPTSPPSPTINTTSSNIYQNPSIPSHLYSQQPRPGQYTGTPEI